MTPVLEAVDLTFKFGEEPLLAGICFKIMQGDLVAVIGSNGAGKSTLLRLALGEIPPASGSIFLFGEDAAHFKDWPRTGYVPQANPAFVNGFPATVEEVVCAGLYSQIGRFMPTKKPHREKACKALGLVGMREYKNRMISKLSGGQLQRVMIARAIAADCELLFLDEPATGVDAESVQNLYRLLGELNRAGMTVLMVTHDIERASGYVNRTLCLEEGTIVELDRAQLEDEMHHRHKHH